MEICFKVLSYLVTILVRIIRILSIDLVFYQTVLYFTMGLVFVTEPSLSDVTMFPVPEQTFSFVRIDIRP